MTSVEICPAPEPELYKKGPGKEARLTFTGHALMENRNALLVDFKVTASVGKTESDASGGNPVAAGPEGSRSGNSRWRQGLPQ